MYVILGALYVHAADTQEATERHRVNTLVLLA